MKTLVRIEKALWITFFFKTAMTCMTENLQRHVWKHLSFAHYNHTAPNCTVLDHIAVGCESFHCCICIFTVSTEWIRVLTNVSYQPQTRDGCVGGRRSPWREPMQTWWEHAGFLELWGDSGNHHTTVQPVNTAKMFPRNHMWLLYFPYFSKHDWVTHFEDEVKGLPVQDKYNNNNTEKKTYPDFSLATLSFYHLFLIWPQLSTPPAEVILHAKPIQQPQALQESACVQNPL